MQRLSIDLMINSFNAIGEADSAKYYSLIIESMFPSIQTNIEQKIINCLKYLVLKKNENMGPYVVQIGAFSNKQNAQRLKLQVRQLGHDVSINKVDSNGKTFLCCANK